MAGMAAVAWVGPRARLCVGPLPSEPFLLRTYLCQACPTPVAGLWSPSLPLVLAPLSTLIWPLPHCFLETGASLLISLNG